MRATKPDARCCICGSTGSANRCRLRSGNSRWTILTQQAQITEKRLKAGDAPRMELNQANAAVAQATVSLHQARMRAELAGNELIATVPR